MRIEVKVPQLPESVAEATLVSWHKKAGEPVRRDENLIDIETDKVVLELPAPGDGVLVEVLKPNGATVTSNDVIAVIDTEAKGAAAADVERGVNALGYALLRAGRRENALALFELNTLVFPRSSNAWDSLAEVHLELGHREEAREFYRASLDLDARNENARAKLAELDGTR